ncbi:MAG TPA: histidine kinase [Maribacter sp.]|uniref:sensor histidine kinase n=1 Tax=unclassified Maribacter TaxID=2615042 RepID=UPI000EE10D6D|nr:MULTISPECIES: histidine kinase [unclassified Maribacter]HAF78290.1 histidine kinase [Maribacter sp.]|tara:strand:- start:60239 stop:61273 length:1035 start_codon:yes stop_codon:yes gene_type:complete
MYKNKNIIIAQHLLIWLVLFSIPFALSYGQNLETGRLIAHFLIPVLFYAIIFYLNFFILIDKFLFAKKTLIFVVLNIIIIGFFMLAKEFIEDNFFSMLIKNRPPENERVGPPFKLFIYIQMLTYAAPLLFSIAIKTTKRWVRTEAERKEADNFKLQTELQHLRYQLQPHFFFNSLNNIYSLVDISPDKAKSTIHSLGKLMRYLLYETNTEMVPLSKEIEFMRKYIELMKLRLTDKTTVESSFPRSEPQINIAPLLFISLIENAFKHGVSANKESVISIDMITQESSVIFQIENYNFPKEDTDKSGSGIGLPNLEKRLHLLYPNKHKFVQEIKDGIYSVYLKIIT